MRFAANTRNYGDLRSAVSAGSETRAEQEGSETRAEQKGSETRAERLSSMIHQPVGVSPGSVQRRANRSRTRGG